MQWKTNRNCRKLLLNMACCNVFFYMQGAWYVAKYEAVVRANSIYSSPVQQSDHSIRRVGPRMEKLDNVSIQNWLIDYYLTSSVAISIHVTLYGPRSGIPYFSLKLWTLPQSRGLPCPPHGDALSRSGGLSHDNHTSFQSIQR